MTARCAHEADGAFVHAPVLPAEVTSAALAAASHVAGRPPHLLDCTLGAGGHAALLLAALPEATLVGLDRDRQALAAARVSLERFGSRVRFVETTFAAWCQSASKAKAEPGTSRFDFVLADFGVSSPQLDHPERGFSFRSLAPLDMRMGHTGETAQELLARLSADELADILFALGEERAARQVARAICEAKPTDTLALAAVVRRAKGRSGAKRGKTDLATKVFMALRMAVNDELGQVAGWLDALPNLLTPEGRFAAISFHSGEDRLVKRAITPPQITCVCSPMASRCSCRPARRWVAIGPCPTAASAAECQANPRARSAKLRVAALASPPA